MRFLFFRQLELVDSLRLDNERLECHYGSRHRQRNLAAGSSLVDAIGEVGLVSEAGGNS